jgi:hypothetical protein
MNLKTLNITAAVVHALILIGLLVWFIVREGTTNFNTQLFKYSYDPFDADFPQVDNNNPDSTKVVATQMVTFSDWTLKTLVLVYFAFTVFFHIFYATNGFGTGIYSRMIQNGNNWVRWIEYGISSTIMTFLGLIVTGVKDFDAVVLAVVANIAMIMTGQIVEAATEMSVKIVGLVIGFLLLVVIFVIIFRNFFYNLSQAKKFDYKVPFYVYAVPILLFIWYVQFGIVAVLNVKNPGNYIKYEKYYIWLSFLSKASLGFFVAFGLTRPKPEKNKTVKVGEYDVDIEEFSKQFETENMEGSGSVESKEF